MAIILDAAVIIQGEKGGFDLKAWIEAHADEHFEVAAITVAELWHGVERATAPHKAKRRRYLQTVLAPLPILPYTEETALCHARIWAQLETAGRMIGYYDLLLAATAVERGSTVATFNRRHFEAVPALKVVVPKFRL